MNSLEQGAADTIRTALLQRLGVSANNVVFKKEYPRWLRRRIGASSLSISNSAWISFVLFLGVWDKRMSFIKRDEGRPYRLSPQVDCE